VKSEDEQMSVVTALVRSSFLINAVYADSAREYGLTSQQGQLLCVLMARPYGMSELGGVLGLAKSSLTGLIDRTAQRGMVRREADAEDGRAVQVALTDKGAELATLFFDETVRRVHELPRGLDEAERSTLAALLARVVRDNKVPAVFGDGGVPAEAYAEPES
jgi:DNA-binding MarR family transcriptional regulator